MVFLNICFIGISSISLTSKKCISASAKKTRGINRKNNEDGSWMDGNGVTAVVTYYLPIILMKGSSTKLGGAAWTIFSFVQAGGSRGHNLRSRMDLGSAAGGQRDSKVGRRGGNLRHITCRTTFF